MHGNSSENQIVRVMCDLETVGRFAGCGILSIGACTFNHTGERQKFYVRISPESNLDYGLHTHADTLEWWSKQPMEVYQEAFGGKTPLKDALSQYYDWIKLQGRDGAIVEHWGNGSDFDNAILTYAYESCGISVPWDFWNSRCYRTLKNLFPEIKAPPREGKHHVALDDAIYQAVHAEALLDFTETRHNVD